MEPWPRPFSRGGGLRLRLPPLHLHMDWNFLRRSAAIALPLMALCARDARAPALTITFLGTGPPGPAMTRFGPSTHLGAAGPETPSVGRTVGAGGGAPVRHHGAAG